MEKTSMNLDCLFEPRSVAVIGASNSIMKWGYIILANIITGGYKGRIYPINPREKSIQGLRAYPDVKDVPDEIDLAMIITPAKTIPEVMKKCASMGVKAAIVVPGGFSEEGSAGRGLEEQIAKIAGEGNIRLVGPNTMGIFSSGSSLCALMPPVRPSAGAISLVAQSGNLGTQLLGLGQAQGIGFSKFVSSGNEAVLFCEDYIDYFGNDSQTGVILAYIEGLDHGRKFLDIAKDTTRKKPIIVFKGGQTKAGSKAVQSHCGAMAGTEVIYNAAFKQAGAVRASTPDEMLDMGKAFARLPLPRGKRVGILTWGGGWGVVTADACEKAGLEIPDLPPATLRAVDEVLPPYWSRGNPIDLVGTLDRGPHLKCLEALVRSENIDAVIALGVVEASSAFGSFIGELSDSTAGMEFFVKEFEKTDREFEKNIIGLINEYGKPIIGVTMGEVINRYPEDHSRPVIYSAPHRAVGVLAKMVEYSNYLKSIEAG